MATSLALFLSILKIRTMKQSMFFITILCASLLSGCNPSGRKKAGDGLQGQISISGAFALYPMTVRWAEEFQKVNPGVRIDISAGGAGKGMADALSGMVDLGMFSREVMPQEIEKGAWYIALTKDAVLPTVNAANPMLKELLVRGITRDELRKIFVTGEITDWGALAGVASGHPITVFTRSDACGAAAMWGEYLGTTQEELLGLGVFGDPGVADAVKNDVLGLGYNNVIYVYDIQTRTKYEKMEVLPIDLDNNGRIDKAESFYQQLDSIMSAIQHGIYPAPPARELYFVSNGKPGNPAAIAFIEWILGEGQRYVQEAGYVQLSPERIRFELEKLHR